MESRDDLLAQLRRAEAQIAAVQDRGTLLSNQAWLRFREGFRKDLEEVQADLLRASDVPLSEHAQGIRRGKRLIIQALLFTPEDVQAGFQKLQDEVQGLHRKLAAWEDRNWSPDPGL